MSAGPVRFQVVAPNMADAIAAAVRGTPDAAAQVLTVVGIETVAYLRSLTDEMRPPVGAYTRRTKGRRRLGGTLEQGPVRKGARRRRLGTVGEVGPLAPTAARTYRGKGQPRPAHPGHWADVRGTLANGYSWKVDRVNGGAVLTLSNPVEYAAHLEARDGFFVLGGVTDPGGPVETFLRQMIPRVRPGWQVVRV